MLQIISGRFFGGGPVRESEEDAILFSNYAWPLPVKTRVAELRPASVLSSSVATYVVRYTNRHESRPGDALVLAAGEEAVDQFRMLCSLGLQAYFHPDRSHLDVLCRGGAQHIQHATPPRDFIPRIFDPTLHGTKEEVDRLVAFVEKALDMPRRQYRLIMSCLRVFFDALEALGTNFDLAYTMLVHVLEALAQSEDGYVATWADYEPGVRDELEREFGSLNPAAAERIRSVLLRASHVKLMKRFVSFTMEHVGDAFFLSEAEGLSNAMPRSKMERALRNLYGSRSGFVHELAKVREQLQLPRAWETTDLFEWEHEPYLTFAGLVRVVRHVFLRFIAKQPVLLREEYDGWRDELPGMVTLHVAPEYWIWQPEGFTPRAAKQRFSGLMDYVGAMFRSERKTIPDMRLLLRKIETLALSSAIEERRPMLALYALVHKLVREEDRLPEWEAFVRCFERDRERCSIEMLATCVVALEPVPWPVSECEEVFERYLTRRHRYGEVHLPVGIEAAIMVTFANLHLEGGNEAAYSAWVDRAVLDLAGHTGDQKLLRDARDEKAVVAVAALLGRQQTTSG